LRREQGSVEKFAPRASLRMHAALHNRLNLLESGSVTSPIERFTVLTGRFVPRSRAEG
jgi:hypothetical protein